MDEGYELLNLRVIRTTTRAAIQSAPDQGDAHRNRASQLLDEAQNRATSQLILDRIDVMRQELADGGFAEREDEVGDA